MSSLNKLRQQAKQKMKQYHNSSATHYLADQRFSFSLDNLLGKGATGNVYKGYDHRQNKHVAVKVIETGKMNQVEKSLIENEKQSLKILKHNNIMKLHHIEEQKYFTFIISQIYEGGSLKEYLQKKGRFSEQEAMEFFRKIIQGYCAIVEANIIHRDLKPTNILLTETNEPVIIDFGYSQIIIANKNLTVFNVGSPSYMSPEAYNKTIYSEKSDIWSLGAIFYELLMNTTLDNNVPTKQYFQSLMNFEYPPINFDLFGDVSKQILKGTLAIKPQQRITSHRIKYLLDKEIIGKRLCNKVMAQPNSSQSNLNYNNHNNKSMKNFELMVKEIDFSKIKAEQQMQHTKKKTITIKNFLNFAVPINLNQQKSIKMIPFTSDEAIQGMIKHQSNKKLNQKNQREFTSCQKSHTGSANNTPSISRIDFKTMQANRNSISTINYVERKFDGSNTNVASNLVMGSRELSKNASTLQVSNFPIRSTLNNTKCLDQTFNSEYFNESIKETKNITYNQGFFYPTPGNNINMTSSVERKPVFSHQGQSLTLSSQIKAGYKNISIERENHNQPQIIHDFLNTLEAKNSGKRLSFAENFKEKPQAVDQKHTERFERKKISQSAYTQNMSQKRNENSQFKLSFKTMVPVSYVDMREGELKSVNRPNRPENNFESQNVMNFREKSQQYQSPKSYQDMGLKNYQINQPSLYQKAHFPPKSGKSNPINLSIDRVGVQNQGQSWNYQQLLQYQQGVCHMRNSSDLDSRNFISLRKLI